MIKCLCSTGWDASFQSYFSSVLASFISEIDIIKLFLAIIICVLLSSCSQPIAIDIKYIEEPCLIPIKNKVWRLCDNMIVRIDSTYHIVPKGFKTDLASIPRFLWWLYAPTDFNSISSAVLHDWHYCCTVGINRYEADNIFYNGLIAQGMSESRATIYYFIVRSFGWMFYANGKNLDIHMAELDIEKLQGVLLDDRYRLG